MLTSDINSEYYCFRNGSEITMLFVRGIHSKSVQGLEAEPPYVVCNRTIQTGLSLQRVNTNAINSPTIVASHTRASHCIRGE